MSEDPEITVGLLAARFDDEYPDSAPEWVADRAARSIAAAERTRILVALLADRIESRRRAKARATEHRAAEVAAYEVEDSRRRAEAAERRRFVEQYPAYAPRNSRLYRRWVATTPEGQRHEERRIAEAAEKAERERLRVEDPAAYDERYDPWRKFVRAVEQMRALGAGHLTTWGRGDRLPARATDCAAHARHRGHGTDCRAA